MAVVVSGGLFIVPSAHADPIPTLGIDDRSVTEGDSGVATATFTISLSIASDVDVSVDVASVDGTASSPSDYGAVSTTVSFAPGETAQTVDLDVNGDTIDEVDETFTMDLTNPVNATIADGQGVGTIIDDDPPQLVLPSSGAWFGAYVAADGHTGSGRQASMLNFESMVGRPMVTDRQYYHWDSVFPTPDDYWTRDQGRVPIWSWNAQRLDGSWARWGDIAAGVYDAQIDARAQAISDFGSPVFLAFHHEPKPGLGATVGTPAEFVAAWRHVHDRFAADGVTNVTWVMILMAETYQQGKAPMFYPGDAYVDMVGADGFNWFGCSLHQGPWVSVQQIFTPFRTFAEAVDKPMMVAEWGAAEDAHNPGRKAQWILDGLDTFRKWPDVKVVSYFHSAPAQSCPRWIDTSASATAAFASIGSDPWFNPPPPLTFQLDITSGPASVTEGSEADLTFTSSDPTVTFTCSLDGAPADPCQDGTATYTGVPVGSHQFEVQGVDALGHSGFATWRWTSVSAVNVTVSDTAVNPKTVSGDEGGVVMWTFIGTGQETVTDSSGMGLFDSGPLGPNDTFMESFSAAGTYPYKSSIHATVAGNVSIPIIAFPSSGSTSDTYAVQWATEPAAPGYAYDVQIKRPGASWKNWKWAQIVKSVTWVPDAGPGAYSFRARLRKPAAAKATGWSPVSVISVT